MICVTHLQQFIYLDFAIVSIVTITWVPHKMLTFPFKTLVLQQDHNVPMHIERKKTDYLYGAFNSFVENIGGGKVVQGVRR